MVLSGKKVQTINFFKGCLQQDKNISSNLIFPAISNIGEKAVEASILNCGSSSVGRAIPCQGIGRGFESRLPLMTESEKENWQSLDYRISEEGLHYCFDGYSDWKEIKDKKFHELRKAYLKSAKELEAYVKLQVEKS